MKSSRVMPEIVIGTCFFFASLCVLPTASAQETADLETQSIAKQAEESLETKKPKLLPARDVIDNHINASGGYEVLESLKNLHYRSVVKGASQVYDFECYWTNGKYKSVYDYQTGHKLTRGVANGKAWQYFEGSTPRAFGGEELQEFLRSTRYLATSTKWLETHEKIETVSIETVNDRDAYKLLFTHKDGSTAEKFFDVETFMCVRNVANEKYRTSTGRTIRDYHDFRKVGEWTVPFRLRISFDGRVFDYETTDFEYDVEIPDGTFELPPNLTAATRFGPVVPALDLKDFKIVPATKKREIEAEAVRERIKRILQKRDR
ncbi:MAG: hypothetical protein AB8B55_06810 [Mariniblastus sp.]